MDARGGIFFTDPGTFDPKSTAATHVYYLDPGGTLHLVTDEIALPNGLTLSPDGRQIVFVASDDGHSRLWLRSLAGTTAQPLAGTDGALYPFWSPDSKSIAFVSKRGQAAPDRTSNTDVWVVSATGGEPRQLTKTEFAEGGRPAWSPDGSRIAGPLVPIAGGFLAQTQRGNLFAFAAPVP